MPLLRSGVLCYTIAKQPEQFRCGGDDTSSGPAGHLPLKGKAMTPHPPQCEHWGTFSSRRRLEAMGCDAIPLQRHTHATHSSCDAVQILRITKLHFSRARTCLAFPKPGVTFTVLCQASALQSFAMPTLDGSMPLLLYAFPQLIYTIPMQNASTPRLAKALQFHRLALPMLCHASPCQGVAIPPPY